MSAQAAAPGRLLQAGGIRQFARLLGEAIAVGFFASVALVAAALLIANAAQATTPDVPTTGTLHFKDSDVPAPLVATDVAIDVSGLVARTRVVQRFVNPGTEWREGIYTFPLPGNAAVDHLEMRIGSRRIEGQIRERAKARREYEQANREGRKAALVEQERPNLFTTSVAQIGPGEEISVAIEYQETLRYDDGAFSLRFPMAITPRYIRGSPSGSAPAGAGTSQDTDAVPDASRITPPVVHPSAGKVLPVTLRVTIDAGFPLAKIDSRHHSVDVVDHADGRATVTLDGPVPASRDFELVFTPDVGRAPAAAVFGEAHDGAAYALVMLMPGLHDANVFRVPREMTLVVDTSGSMAGPAMQQAKAAVLFALERLQPGDRFNVIEFDSHARALFASPVPVDPATIGRARSFVSSLKADGGTEMLGALALAFAPPRAEGYVRQVVFVTDGAVGNEDELFRLIRERLDDRRLFTVGIGSAPNSHFMTKAAQFGRGTFTYIGDTREVQERMAALIRKLESPIVTDVAIDWPHAGVESWPQKLPDLYAGEPIVVTAALPSLSGEVTLRGLHAGVPWRKSLPLGLPGEASGIGVLWARAKVEALEDARLAGANEDETRSEIVRVALAHHIVTKHTSLVAIDVTPTAPPGLVGRPSAVPGNLPDGQVHEAIFGGLPQTATSARSNLLTAIGALLAAIMLLALGRQRVGR